LMTKGQKEGTAGREGWSYAQVRVLGRVVQEAGGSLGRTSIVISPVPGRVGLELGPGRRRFAQRSWVLAMVVSREGTL
jgi:hypothetical protein